MIQLAVAYDSLIDKMKDSQHFYLYQITSCQPIMVKKAKMLHVQYLNFFSNGHVFEECLKNSSKPTPDIF